MSPKSPIEQIEEAIATGRSIRIEPDGTIIEGAIEEPVVTKPLTQRADLDWEY